MPQLPHSLEESARYKVGTGQYPILGHLPTFIKRPRKLLDDGYRENRTYFQYKLGPKRVHVLVDPQWAQSFFKAREDQLSTKEVYGVMKYVFGKGIIYDAGPEIMEEHVGFIRFLFQPKSLTFYVKTVIEEIDVVIKKLGDTGAFDPFELFNELNVALALRYLTGRKADAALINEAKELYGELSKSLTSLSLIFPWLPVPKHLRRDRALKKLSKIMNDAVRKHRAGDDSSSPVITGLLHARYSDGRALDDRIISGILIGLLFGSQLTSTVFMSWMGLRIGTEDAYARKLRLEADGLLANGNSPTLGQIKQLHAWGMFVKEVERLHPPIMLIMRYVKAELQLGGMSVPKGDLVATVPYLTHLLPEVFENPHTFDPSRFDADRREDKNLPHGLIGFGGGAHKCPGLGLALLQSKLVWMSLLHKYDISASVAFEFSEAALEQKPTGATKIEYRAR